MPQNHSLILYESETSAVKEFLQQRPLYISPDKRGSQAIVARSKRGAVPEIQIFRDPTTGIRQDGSPDREVAVQAIGPAAGGLGGLLQLLDPRVGEHGFSAQSTRACKLRQSVSIVTHRQRFLRPHAIFGKALPSRSIRVPPFRSAA